MPAKQGFLRLSARTQELRQNEWGGNYWHSTETAQKLRAKETALLLCDVWDKHWSRGATRRVGEMAPRMNEVVKAARSMGVFIIHAPSDTMEFYNDAPRSQKDDRGSSYAATKPRSSPGPHPIRSTLPTVGRTLARNRGTRPGNASIRQSRSTRASTVSATAAKRCGTLCNKEASRTCSSWVCTRTCAF